MVPIPKNFNINLLTSDLRLVCTKSEGTKFSIADWHQAKNSEEVNLV